MNRILVTLLWFYLIGFLQACHYYRVSDKNRKRRDLINHVKTTQHLRNYFKRCMTQQTKGMERLDWESIVDYTILDSSWFENTEQVYCSAASGGLTEDCWQGEVKRFLAQENNNIFHRTLICVTHYTEDKNFYPPRDRYAPTRTKRQSIAFPFFISNSHSIGSAFPLQDGAMDSFVDCLRNVVLLPEERAPVNFNALSRFIAQYTRDSRCSAQSKYPVTWQLRFIALTRSDSPLRGALQQCAQNEVTGYFWSSWSGWEKCTSTCGVGIQIRRRSCRLKKDPFRTVLNGCKSNLRQQIRSCRNPQCRPQLIYQWSPWVATSCSRTCGNGIQSRSRSCLNHRGFESPQRFCGGHLGMKLYYQRRLCFSKKCTHSWFDSRITSFAETIMNEMHDDDDDDEPN